MQESQTQDSGSSAVNGNGNENAKDHAIDGLALIIVHTNDVHDPFSYSRRGTQELIDSGIFSTIYEHMAYHSSEVKHQGIIIDNEINPAYYIIPDLKGKEFVLAGGCVGACHYGAYLALLSMMFHKSKRIHFPLDCMYDVGEGYDSGETYLKSLEVSLDHHSFEAKYFPLLSLCSFNSSIRIDGELKSGSQSFHPPQTDLLIWKNRGDMIDYVLRSCQDTPKME